MNMFERQADYRKCKHFAYNTSVACKYIFIYKRNWKLQTFLPEICEYANALCIRCLSRPFSPKHPMKRMQSPEAFTA